MILFLKMFGATLLALGPRRLAALATAGVVVFSLVAASGYFLSRPDREVLYSGLDPADATTIGAALADAGMAFDVSAAGDSVMVDRGNGARARMLLAQKGLPRSGTAGYELFDKLGSMGLTSFMQQVTKVRALEGELARTIQLIDGIKAARVHLALAGDGGFRTGPQKAAASVIIRSDDATGEAATRAIRHLVAAAVPSLTPSQVTVMGTDGRLFSSLDDDATATPEKLIGLERSLAADVERNILRTLTPYLGLDNVRVSVTAKLNADRRQINETNFDPNSRVERSIRTFKESGEAENANGADPVSVDQNIPQEDTPKAPGDSSKEKKDRKEELTNYEINSKSVATTSDGYGIERLSVAVVVNRGQLRKILGDGSTDEAIAAQIGEIRKLVQSASGYQESRGDQLEIAPVDFDAADLAPAETVGGFSEMLTVHLGSLLNAGALLLAVLLTIFLGLRPALRQILPAPTTEQQPALSSTDGLDGQPVLASPEAQAIGAAPALNAIGADPLLEDLARQVTNGPRDRLIKIVELDPDRAAEVLRQWLNDPAEAGA